MDDRFLQGLVLGFKTNKVPGSGSALILGGIRDQYPIYLVDLFPQKTVVIEPNVPLVTSLQRYFENMRKRISLQAMRAQDIRVTPWSLSVVTVSMADYLPEYAVVDLLKKIWQGLLSGGILQVEFCALNDPVRYGRFVTSHCREITPRSFIHQCSNNCPYFLLGRDGFSFWDKEMALKAMRCLGNSQVLSMIPLNWNERREDGRPRVRYSWVVTVQKT